VTYSPVTPTSPVTDPDPAVVDEIVREGATAGPRDVIERVERAHEGRGVERATVEAYAGALADRDDYAFDAEAFLEGVDAETTDADRWAGGGYYAVGDGRISLFPAAWHDTLDESTDVAAYVAFMQDEDPAYLEDLDRGGPGAGVPQRAVVEALTLLGGVDRGSARGLIAQARDEGDVVEDADQNPDTDVYLPERAPEALR